MQYLKDAEFEALMAAIHRCNQLGLPLVLIAAGLPKSLKLPAISSLMLNASSNLFPWISCKRMMPSRL